MVFAPERFAEHIEWLNRRAAECLRDLARIEHLIADGAEFGAWDERTSAFLNLLAQGRGAHRQLRHIADLLEHYSAVAATPIAAPPFEQWRAAQLEIVETRCSRQRPLYGVEDLDRRAA